MTTRYATSSNEKPGPSALARYYAAVAGFFVSLALALLALVDMRRAFLFPAAEYFRVGQPTAVLNLDIYHLPMLVAGAIGLFLSYRYMARAEGAFDMTGTKLKGIARTLAVGIAVALVIDLLTYRAVPAARALAAGKLGVGQAIPAGLPSWLDPLADAANYLLLVWHATYLGILLGGLYLVAGSRLVTRLQGSGLRPHLAGAAMAIPQPFCSCCAAPVGAALYRRGAALGPLLSFAVSSPMLNITGLILASALLPFRFALLRILGGVAIGVLLTYLVSIVGQRWVRGRDNGPAPGRAGWLSKVLSAYGRLFRFEQPNPGDSLDSATALLSAWMRASWRLAKVVVPVLFLGAVMAALVAPSLPAPANNPLGVAAAAVLGTLLMIPTWTEIGFSAGLIAKGLTGPAAALLLALPAVSLPALAVIAGATGSARVALLLGALVAASGVLAGLAFL